MITVRAKYFGFYGNRRRKEGDVFVIKDEQSFSEKWMEKVKLKKEPKIDEDATQEYTSPDETGGDIVDEQGFPTNAAVKRMSKPNLLALALEYGISDTIDVENITRADLIELIIQEIELKKEVG